MPSVSKAQQHLMQAAEHGADFPMAKKIRKSMTHQQMHDFSVGSEKGKPQHVGIKGSSKDVIASNTNTMKQMGMSEADATKHAIKKANHPHKNLGKYLHPKKGS